MHKGNYKARMENLRNTLFILILSRDGLQQSKPKHQRKQQSDFMITLLIGNMFFFQITQGTQGRKYDSCIAMRKQNPTTVAKTDLAVIY